MSDSNPAPAIIINGKEVYVEDCKKGGVELCGCKVFWAFLDPNDNRKPWLGPDLTSGEPKVPFWGTKNDIWHGVDHYGKRHFCRPCGAGGMDEPGCGARVVVRYEMQENGKVKQVLYPAWMKGKRPHECDYVRWLQGKSLRGDYKPGWMKQKGSKPTPQEAYPRIKAVDNIPEATFQDLIKPVAPIEPPQEEEKEKEKEKEEEIQPPVVAPEVKRFTPEKIKSEVADLTKSLLESEVEKNANLLSAVQAQNKRIASLEDEMSSMKYNFAQIEGGLDKVFEAIKHLGDLL